VQLVLRAAVCGAALALFLPRAGEPAITPEQLFGVLVLANMMPLIALRFTQPHAGAAARAQALLRRELRTARPGMTLAAAAALAFAVPFVSHEFRAVDLVFRIAMALQVLAAMLTYERTWIHTGQVPRIS
jgi:hypothetical protein